MSSQLKLNIFMVLLATFAQDVAMAHQCYVCGVDDNLNCDKFDPTNKNFVKDCPDAKACIIQTQTHVGTVLVRSCENTKLQDCQTANNIEYCYCSRDLCNANKFVPPPDDEDFAEGSGTSNVIINVQVKDTTTNITNNSNQATFIFYKHSYVLVLAVLYN